MATKPTTPTKPTAASAPQLLKKSGPPVPPRPQHTLAAASLLKAQRGSTATKQRLNGVATTTISPASPTSPTSSSTLNTKITVSTSTSTSEVAGSANGVGVASASAGRTIIYKSPSINLEKKQEEREKRSLGVGTNLNRTMSAPKPPLKLRKAPDIPLPKPNQIETTSPPPSQKTAINRIESFSTTSKTMPPQQVTNDNNNIIIVQSSNSVTLSRHNSMGGSPTKNIDLRDTRLSLDGKISGGVAGPINLEQLKPAQPLPRPRKIVKVPVATLDVDDFGDTKDTKDTNINNSNNIISNNIFRRSKTTLDNLASRANITTISTVNASNSFLGGKTVEIKNNLKNAAERLFSEIIVNQQQKQQTTEQATTIITKHERAIQHQAVVELDRERKHQQETQTPTCKVTVVTTTTPTKQNCTRININTTNNIKNENTNDINNINPSNKIQKIDINPPSTEKKIAFHEILISELAAMRAKSSSMEALSTISKNSHSEMMMMMNATETPTKQMQKQNSPPPTSTSPSHQELKKPVAVALTTATDSEDVDADNLDDVEIDDDELTKHLKVANNNNRNNNNNVSMNTPRKRCPSGCSSDSSPYGTERSSRIRTSDWIEVGDNGKKVNMSSCHISLEDSGLEDEERLSSSGVGDSWDSVKEVENDKRSRSVQRAMSITELPPLPKSLSGFNKLIVSDSGHLNENDENIDKNSNELLNHQTDTQTNCNDMNDISNNNNNNQNNNDDSGTDNSINQSTKSGDNDIETKTTIGNGIPSASTTLDMQLATLKKEMYGLRQLDLSLLSQLWALNDSIQEFRTILQEQDDDDDDDDDDSYSHSPSPSSYDSVSTDGEDDVIIGKQKMLGAKPKKIITQQPKLLAKPMTEIQHHQQNQHHQHHQHHQHQHNHQHHPKQHHKEKLANLNHDEAINLSKIQQHQQHQKPPAPLPKPQIVPRMRSAPPPPPPSHKTQSPTRQT